MRSKKPALTRRLADFPFHLKTTLLHSLAGRLAPQHDFIQLSTLQLYHLTTRMQLYFDFSCLYFYSLRNGVS